MNLQYRATQRALTAVATQTLLGNKQKSVFVGCKKHQTIGPDHVCGPFR